MYATQMKPSQRPGLHRWTLEQRIAYYTAPPLPNGCKLWVGAMDTAGYGRLHWKRKSWSVPRLVLAAKLGRRIKPGMDACHSQQCSSRACITEDHLREDTRKGNVRDAVITQRHIHGQRHHWAKLTYAQVRQIKKKLLGRVRQCDLAEQYGVSRATICLIASGKNWSNVK